MVAIDAATRGDRRSAGAESCAGEPRARASGGVPERCRRLVAVNQLESAAARGEVLSLRAAMAHKHAATGPVATQGDYAQGSSVLRTDYPMLTDPASRWACSPTASTAMRSTPRRTAAYRYRARWGTPTTGSAPTCERHNDGRAALGRERARGGGLFELPVPRQCESADRAPVQRRGPCDAADRARGRARREPRVLHRGQQRSGFRERHPGARQCRRQGDRRRPRLLR